MRCKILLFFAISSLPLTSTFAKSHPASVIQAVETISPSQCFFTPPEAWEVTDPRSLSPKVKIAFLKNNNKGFCPSINLAIEETDVSLNDYLKAVKAIHEQDRNNQWRALGKVRTAAGMAQLTEIDSTTEWGAVRILQLIFIKEGRAYVITAAALKEEISNYYKDFQSAFRSFTISNDLLSNIPQLQRRETLKEKQADLFATSEKYFHSSDKQNPFDDPTFQQKHWLPFQKTVIDNFGDMGAFWQILILRNAHEKLLSLQDSTTASKNK
ncbi:MAG: hypothetical protein WA347_01490 [Rhabdochlamydiaceae bacterium]